MKFSDFEIGKEFKWLNQRHICTDIGTRVIVAICVEKTVVVTYRPEYKITSHNTIFYDEIIKDGWHLGPPYALQEIVIDDFHLPECQEIIRERV